MRTLSCVVVHYVHRRQKHFLMLVLHLACAQISSVTLLICIYSLLVFMKQVKALTKAADVCSAARMRPDPKLPAFSMEPPLRVAQALLQSLAVLLPFLLTCLPPTPHPPKTVQSADLNTDKTAKQTVLQHLASSSPDLPAAFRMDKGRPVPARLSLQQKLDQSSVKRLIGERRKFTLKAFESFT